MTSLEATYLFGYVETSMIPSDRSCVFRKARQRTVNWTGSKMKCVELCNFHFCCAFIYGEPMKKFEFFGASRATRERHFKTSSTGDENAKIPAGNFLLCFAILLAGGYASKVIKIFNHMGLACISLSTFFQHQRVSSM